MRGIAKLLFGEDVGKLLDRFTPNDGDFSGSDGDGFRLAERARRAGEWCGTTPGRDPGAGGVARPVSRRSARP